ncbi:MAG TPA: replication protein RepA [Terriglobales bacterium]|nr:replication protein RepA [Terriglobales bacterium]
MQPDRSTVAGPRQQNRADAKRDRQHANEQDLFLEDDLQLLFDLAGDVRPTELRVVPPQGSLFGKPESPQRERRVIIPDLAWISLLWAHVGLPVRPLPDRSPGVPEIEWASKNGAVTMRFVNTIGAGVPSGAFARLLLSFITGWVKMNPKEDHVSFGKNAARFLTQEWPWGLGIEATGGSRGTIVTLTREALRLFPSTMSVALEQPVHGLTAFELVSIVRKGEWWFRASAAAPHEEAIFPSAIELNPQFRELVLEHRIPVDRRALFALRHSPLQMDQYVWLAWRLRLVEPGVPYSIRWEALRRQFGSQQERLDKFRELFARNLKHVKLKAYTDANFKVRPDALVLHHSPPPVQETTITTIDLGNAPR